MKQTPGLQEPRSSAQRPRWGRRARGQPRRLPAEACACPRQVQRVPGARTSAGAPPPGCQGPACRLCPPDACSTVSLLSRAARKKPLVMKGIRGLTFAPRKSTQWEGCSHGGLPSSSVLATQELFTLARRKLDFLGGAGTWRTFQAKGL